MSNVDKLYHMLVGAAIYSIVYLLSGMAIPAFLTVMILGVGKEVYDSVVPEHTPDANDISATVLGGMIMYVLFH